MATKSREDIRELLGKLRKHVLSSPTRLTISLVLLIRDEIEFNELQKALGITPGALWSHLTKMNESGILKLKRRFSPTGPRLVISLTSKGREEVLNYVETLNKLIKMGKP